MRSGPTRTDNQHGDFFFDKATIGQIHELGSIEMGIKIQIETLQCFVVSEPGTPEPHGVFLLLPAGHFILNQQRQELRIQELVFNGVPVTTG